VDILAQLKSARNKVAFELGRLEAAITALSGSKRNTGRRKRRKMSAKSRAKIAAAQRARWAAWKAKQKKA
jgi:hypothetical protein